jgi:hypothetical protein
LQGGQTKRRKVSVVVVLKVGFAGLVKFRAEANIRPQHPKEKALDLKRRSNLATIGAWVRMVGAPL